MPALNKRTVCAQLTVLAAAYRDETENDPQLCQISHSHRNHNMMQLMCADGCASIHDSTCLSDLQPKSQRRESQAPNNAPRYAMAGLQ